MLDLFILFGIIFFAGYHIPTSKGRPPEPSAIPAWSSSKHYKTVPPNISAIPAWSRSTYYKTVPPKSKAESAASQTLADLAEAMDEGYHPPPANPAESSTSSSSWAAARRNWVEHPWEPTEEDLA